MLQTIAHPRLIFRLSLLGAAILLLGATLPADLAAFADISSRPLPGQVIKKSLPPPKAVAAPGTLTKPTPQSVPAGAKTASPSIERTWATAAIASPKPETLVAAVFSSGEPAGLRPGRIGRSAVNVRNGPSKSAAALMVLQAGTDVRVGETVNGWVHVYAAQGSGWIYSSFLSGVALGQPRIAKLETTQPATLQASKPNAVRPRGRLEVVSAMQVRDEPGGDPVYRLSPGERVRIVEVEGKWARITTTGGESGWIRIR